MGNLSGEASTPNISTKPWTVPYLPNNSHVISDVTVITAWISKATHPTRSSAKSDAATTPTTSAASSPLPEVESCVNTPGAVKLRPTLIGFGCAGLNTTVTALSWSSWTSAIAIGTGTFNQDTCTPDCADGSYNTHPVNVLLTDPGDYLGHLVFQDVTVTPTSGGSPVESDDGPGNGWGTG
jgi:hypothetical protein